MGKFRLWKVFALLLGVSLAATVQAPRPVLAQTGLDIFEKEIKPQLKFKTFTYGKATAIGSKGFALENVTVVVPAEATGTQDTTIKIAKLTVDEADFERLRASSNSDDLPRFAKLRIEGMTGDDALNGMFESFGVPKAPVDLVLDYRLDPASKVLNLSRLEIALQGQGSVSLSMILEGASDKASDSAGAKDNSRLRSAALDYSDTGLLLQLLPAVAKQQGMSVDAMVAMAAAPIGAFAAGKSPETVKALDALASFIADWKKPQGPIRISVTPSKSASFADLDKIEQPNALSDIFGLRIEYAGTRIGATGAPAGGAEGVRGRTQGRRDGEGRGQGPCGFARGQVHGVPGPRGLSRGAAEAAGRGKRKRESFFVLLFFFSVFQNNQNSHFHIPFFLFESQPTN